MVIHASSNILKNPKKENFKINPNFLEKNTGPGTKFPNFYNTLLKDIGQSVRKQGK